MLAPPVLRGPLVLLVSPAILVLLDLPGRWDRPAKTVRPVLSGIPAPLALLVLLARTVSRVTSGLLVSAAPLVLPASAGPLASVACPASAVQLAKKEKTARSVRMDR